MKNKTLPILLGVLILAGIGSAVAYKVVFNQPSDIDTAPTVPYSDREALVVAMELDKEIERLEKKEKLSKKKYSGQITTRVLIEGIRVPDEPSADTPLEFGMSVNWSKLSYQERLQAAKTLQSLWAARFSPDEPENAYIRLRDRLSNNLGGSSDSDGSRVWVNKVQEHLIEPKYDGP